MNVARDHLLSVCSEHCFLTLLHNVPVRKAVNLACACVAVGSLVCFSFVFRKLRETATPKPSRAEVQRRNDGEHVTLDQLFGQLYLLLNEIQTRLIFIRARVSLALLSMRESEGLIVVFSQKNRLVRKLLKIAYSAS